MMDTAERELMIEVTKAQLEIAETEERRWNERVYDLAMRLASLEMRPSRLLVRA